MINSQYFEIPDFCATHTRQGGCNDCLDIFNSACANAFGLNCAPNNAPPPCTCHDICVEEVRLIGTTSTNCEFTQCFNYPPIGPCRLGAGITLPALDTMIPAKVFVVCAQEILGDNCQAINVKVKIFILAPTLPSGNVLIPLDIDVSFTEFFTFPDCQGPITGNALQNALTEIDGSCLVIQLKAQAQAIPGQNGTQIVVTGKIIDKLWKHENLWVTGIRPYNLTADQITAGYVSFTIQDIFNNSHKIGDCTPIPCQP